jgi:hypothetical protein
MVITTMCACVCMVVQAEKQAGSKRSYGRAPPKLDGALTEKGGNQPGRLKKRQKARLRPCACRSCEENDARPMPRRVILLFIIILFPNAGRSRFGANIVTRNPMGIAKDL